MGPLPLAGEGWPEGRAEQPQRALIPRFVPPSPASGGRGIQEGTFVRGFVLFAHPVETSFNAAIHAKLVATLRSRGHEIDDCDLNAEGFDPVLNRQDRIQYHTVGVNRARVAQYVARLLAAEALVLSYPVWNMGFPAILKGFLDRVFLPGVSFDLKEDGTYTPTLHNIKRLRAASTYGGGCLLFISRAAPPR